MTSEKQQRLIFFWVGIFFSLSLLAQDADYDPELAKKLRADDYGMKSYTFVILKTGPTKVEDPQKVSELMRGHLDNIGKLAEEGKLIVAGPFGKNDLQYRGLFILTIQDIEEAKALLQTDPAIKAGVFELELIPWYGAAALGTYLDTQKKITKTHP